MVEITSDARRRFSLNRTAFTLSKQLQLLLLLLGACYCCYVALAGPDEQGQLLGYPGLTGTIIGHSSNDPLVEKCRASMVTRPANVNYGAWTFCEDILQPQQPTIVSFGIGEDMEWEKHMIEHYNATVFAHDPTPKSVAFVDQQKAKYPTILPGLKFTAVGLGVVDNDSVTMNLPKDDNHVSGRIGQETGGTRTTQIRVVTLPTAYEMHHIQMADIVKIDVEGIEFDVLDSLLANGGTIHTKLFLVEFHDRFFPGQHKQQKAVDLLQKAGFVHMHTSNNGEELVFLNLKEMSIR